jgi:hypothetical protein
MSAWYFWRYAGTQKGSHRFSWWGDPIVNDEAGLAVVAQVSKKEGTR